MTFLEIFSMQGEKYYFCMEGSMRDEIEPTRGEIEPTRGEIEPTQGEIEPMRGEIEPTRGEIEHRNKHQKEHPSLGAQSG